MTLFYGAISDDDDDTTDGIVSRRIQIRLYDPVILLSPDPPGCMIRGSRSVVSRFIA